PVNVMDNYPLCWYPNRDSLHYIDLYELKGISTFIRTTLRHPVFCHGWNKFVNMGLTDTSDHDQIKNCVTFKEWFNKKADPITDEFKSEFIEQLHFLELESNKQLPENCKSSADILQYILERKLAIKEDDKDMIVMLHEIEYTVNSQQSTVNSLLIVKGEDRLRTAMAKTVGLPLGIATKLILQDKIKISGLHIPIVPEIYIPVLEELEKNGIVFNEQTLS
ncbi:MAG: saccharopine dehydrogenase C-terminal domain-containing protein, partial [Ginsengibacter sp.]